MPAARAEPSCITAHPAHDPLATPHRLQGETYLWSIQMSPFSSRWVGGWWRCEQCSGAALGLRLRCITIGLTWESYSTISHPCTVCNAHPILDYSMHQHPTLHHTWPNLKTSSIVKVWNILIPLHHLTLRESLCFKNQTNKVVIYKHLLQAKMAPVCFVKIFLNWETIWPFDPGLTIRFSDKASNIGG